MAPWIVLIAGASVAFISNGVRMSYGVFVVPLEEALGLTRSQVILPFSLSMVMWGLLQPFTGAFMDSRGPRKAILLATFVMTLGFAVAAGAQNLWQLILGYGLLVGASASGLTMAAFSLLVNRWFLERRGRAIGLILAGIPMGTLIFSPVTAALIASWNWRGSFLILSTTMVLLVLPLAWFFLREPPGTGEKSSATPTKGALIFNKEVLEATKSRVYWILLLKYFGCGFSGFFLLGHLPAIASSHGLSPQQGATALGLIGAGGALGAILGGWASDRVGRYRALVVGYLTRAVGAFLLAYSVSGVTSFYVVSVIAGMPTYFTISITQLIIYEIFGLRIAGRMMGLTFLLHQVGATLGPLFGGWIFETTGTYRLGLVTLGVVLCNSAFWSRRLEGATQRYLALNVDSSASTDRTNLPR